MEKILVTGGAGFIGIHTVQRLLDEGFNVIVIDKAEGKKFKERFPEVSYYKEDINSENINYIFKVEKPQGVIHLAAQVNVQMSIHQPTMDAQINIQGTLAVLNACAKYQVQTFVYASSAAIYGNPTYLPVDEEHACNPLSFYGTSKYVPEMYISQFASLYDISYTILRYANVYGPKQCQGGEGGIISNFIQCIDRGGSPVIYGDGSHTRDYIYVKDVANANVLALKNSKNRIYNISTNYETSIWGLLDVIREILDKNVTPVLKPERIGDIQRSFLNNQKALDDLKWSPSYSLKAGLTEMLGAFSVV